MPERALFCFADMNSGGDGGAGAARCAGPLRQTFYILNVCMRTKVVRIMNVMPIAFLFMPEMRLDKPQTLC